MRLVTLALVGALSVITSCTFKPYQDKVSLKLVMQTPEPHRGVFSLGREGVPATVGDMDCFLVSVSGSVIPPVGFPASSKLSNAAGSCPVFGAVSELVTLNSLTTDGVLVPVPPGPERTITIYGVETHSAGGCAGKKGFLDFVGAESRPSFYEVGALTVNLTSIDPTISISSNYVAATTPDLIETCTGVESLALSPGVGAITTANTLDFSASGGVPPYTYTVPTGPGSIASDGRYTPSSTGTAEIKVTDDAGFAASATLSVVAPLAIGPSSKSMAVTNTFTFTASGGVAPLRYSLESGSGTLNEDTGVYVAPSSSGTAVIRVTDSATVTANVSEANVAIEPALAISPTTPTTAVTNTVTFSAIGGVGTRTFSIPPGGGAGSIDPVSGAFTAPAVAGTTTIRVTDSMTPTANISSTTVTINGPVVISPAAKTLAVLNSFTFTATGGVPGSGYTYSVPVGDGTIGSTSGVYTAGTSAGSATVRVTDSLGNFSEAAVTVNNALAISPTTKTLAVGNSFDFSDSGGVGAIAYSVIPSTAGSVTGMGVFTASSEVGIATVRVTDTLGNVADATVTVNAALTMPSAKAFVVNEPFTFGAANGVPPYTYSTTEGLINTLTGEFTAPSTTVPGVVTATDNVGNTATTSFTTAAALSLAPVGYEMTSANTVTFVGSGGTGPYTYSLVSGGGTIDPNSGLYNPSGEVGNFLVRVTDSATRQTQQLVTVNDPLSIVPPAINLLSNEDFSFSSNGGVGTKTFSKTSGNGTMQPTGDFTAAVSSNLSGDEVQVRVADSYVPINQSEAMIKVYPALNITPTSPTVAIGGTIDFDASGGVGPTLTFSKSGPGTLNTTSGFFTATAAGPVTITVSDSDSPPNTKSTVVTVTGGSLVVTPSTVSLKVATPQTFSAIGADPITYSVVGGLGTVGETSGTYVRDWLSGETSVQATDAMGATGIAPITNLPGAIQLGAGAGKNTSPVAQKIDASGNLFVLGKTSGNLGLGVSPGHAQSGTSGYGDAFLASYAPTGVQRWILQLGSGSFAFTTPLHHLTGVTNGAHFIAGETTGSLGGAQQGTKGPKDSFVSRIGANGLMEWKAQLGAGVAATTTLAPVGGLTLNADDDSFLCGATDGNDLGVEVAAFNLGNKDAWLMKRDAAASLQFLRQFGGGDATDTYPVGCVLNTDPQSPLLYMVGITNGELGIKSYTPGLQDFFIAKFAADTGAIDPNISIVQKGGSTNGTIDQNSLSFYLDEADEAIYVYGEVEGVLYPDSPGHGTRDIFVAQYNAYTLALNWIKQVGGGDFTYSYIAPASFVSKGSYVYLAGRTTGMLATLETGYEHGTEDMFLLRLSKFDGDYLAANRQLGKSASTTRAKTLVVDNSGNVFVYGTTTSSLFGEALHELGTENVFVAKFASSILLQWAKQLGSESVETLPVTPNSNRDNLDLHLKNGFLYFSGYSPGDLGGTSVGPNGIKRFVARLDTSGGNFQVSQFGGGSFSGPSGGLLAIGEATPFLFGVGDMNGTLGDETFYGALGQSNLMLVKFNGALGRQ